MICCTRSTPRSAQRDTSPAARRSDLVERISRVRSAARHDPRHRRRPRRAQLTLGGEGVAMRSSPRSRSARSDRFALEVYQGHDDAAWYQALLDLARACDAGRPMPTCVAPALQRHPGAQDEGIIGEAELHVLRARLTAADPRRSRPPAGHRPAGRAGLGGRRTVPLARRGGSGSSPRSSTASRCTTVPAGLAIARGRRFYAGHFQTAEIAAAPVRSPGSALSTPCAPALTQPRLCRHLSIRRTRPAPLLGRKQSDAARNVGCREESRS